MWTYLVQFIFHGLWAYSNLKVEPLLISREISLKKIRPNETNKLVIQKLSSTFIIHKLIFYKKYQLIILFKSRIHKLINYLKNNVLLTIWTRKSNWAHKEFVWWWNNYFWSLHFTCSCPSPFKRLFSKNKTLNKYSN